MNVLFLAAEAAPLAKVGGLGDVAGELPEALRQEGYSVRVVLPYHASVPRSLVDPAPICEIQVPHAGGNISSRLLRTLSHEEETYLVDGDPVAAVPEVYSTPAQDASKFTFAFISAMLAMQSMHWKPAVVHAHDWHAAPALAWLKQRRLKDPFWSETGGLLTIHNLPYQGVGGESALQEYGISPATDDSIPEWGRGLPLSVGLDAADRLNAVSPGYAREIQTPAFGCGLEGFFQTHKMRLSGILNGIDLARWNPENDPSLPKQYSRQNLPARQDVKQALLHQLGLLHNTEAPLLAIISRLEHQKGIDLALDALAQLADHPWQFILLGKGNPDLEALARDFAAQNGHRARVVIGFDAQLARRIYAGADILLLPSRYEPCGLAQMIAMRYGCVPVAAATGGLQDTVIDYDADRSGTGFTFSPTESGAMAMRLRRALEVYTDKRRWRGLQRRGMGMDFSWRGAARQYGNLYQTIVSERVS